jgi:hypothetical protein
MEVYSQSLFIEKGRKRKIIYRSKVAKINHEKASNSKNGHFQNTP